MDKNEVKEVARELLGWEGNKIFRTIKYLTIKPGQIITEFCEGEKQKYLSPVVYFFSVSGIILYLQSLSGLSDFVRATETLGIFKEMFFDFGIGLSDTQVIRFFNALENQPLMMLLGLPANLVVTWMLFRRHKPSFKQTSWFVIYISAQSSLLFVLPILCFWFISKEALFLFFSNIVAPIMIAYSIWAAMQFYKVEIGRAILLIFLKLIILIPFNVLCLAAVFYIIISYTH